MSKTPPSKETKARARAESPGQRLRRVATPLLVAELPVRLARHQEQTDAVLASVPSLAPHYSATLAPYRTLVDLLSDLPAVYGRAERRIRGLILAFTDISPEPGPPGGPGPGHVQIVQHVELTALSAELHTRLAATYVAVPALLESHPPLADLLGAELARYGALVDTLSHLPECLRNVTRVVDALRVLGDVTPVDFEALAAAFPSDPSAGAVSPDTDTASGGTASGTAEFPS